MKFKPFGEEKKQVVIKLPCICSNIEKEEFIQGSINYNAKNYNTFLDSQFDCILCYKCGSKLAMSALKNQLSEQELNEISEKILSEIEAQHNNKVQSEVETKKETPHEFPSNQVKENPKTEPSYKQKSAFDDTITKNFIPEKSSNLNNVNSRNESINDNKNIKSEILSIVKNDIGKKFENLDSNNSKQIFYEKDSIQIESIFNSENLDFEINKKVKFSPLEEIENLSEIKKTDSKVIESKIVTEFKEDSEIK